MVLSKKLKTIFIKFVCLFIPVKRWRQRMRGEKSPKIYPLKKTILQLPFIPKVKNSEETVEALIHEKKSICRFGDGEISLIKGRSIPFQSVSPTLSHRLKEVLQSDDQNVMLGINYSYWHYKKSPYKTVEKFYNNCVSRNLTRNLNSITALLSNTKRYYSSTFTIPFSTSNRGNFDSFYSKVKAIWQDKDITIVCGNTVFDNIKNNIFDCAKSIDFIDAPSQNAFNHYTDLLETVKQVDKNRMLILILGPTATILAYDMAKLGYRALDMGHIAKDYDWYKKQVKHNKKTLHAFFAPD